MAEHKSEKELATELTIEYMRESSTLDSILEAWCRFHDTIRIGVPAKKVEQKEG